MAFDTSVVSLLPIVEDHPGQLSVRWTTTAPPGTWYQVYLGRRLATYTQDLRATLPTPAAPTRIDVGAVGAGERTTDFASSLPAAHAVRATLAWKGGTYLDPTGAGDVAGFRIYREPTPGAGVDYTRPVADLSAYVGGVVTDGYGLGGYGEGGFGMAASSYSWTSDALAWGTWTFAVRAYDAAGNEGPPLTTAVAIAAPPPPPPLDPARRVRLWYAYDPSTRVATLNWLPALED